MPSPQEIKIASDNLGILVFNSTNAYRKSKGLPNLRHQLGFNGPAGQAAQKYAEFQAQNNTSGHNDDGHTPDQRMTAEGAKICQWAENVFEYYSTPNVATIQDVAAAAMEWWKKSPPHEKNMTSDKVYILGTGAAAWKHGDRNYYYLVQDFLDDCTPADQRNVRKLGKRPR